MTAGGRRLRRYDGAMYSATLSPAAIMAAGAAESGGLLGRHERVVAVDLAGVEEVAARGDLRDRRVIVEHQLRVDVGVVGQLVVTHCTEGVATVRTLEVVGRAEVVLVEARVVRPEGVAGRRVDRERAARVAALIEVAWVARRRAAATVRQRRGGVAGRGERARREVAVALQHFVVVADTGVGRDVAAAVFGADAHQDVELGATAVGDVVARQAELRRIGRRAALDHVTQLDGAVAIEVVLVLVEAVLGVELHALEVLLHDEVDDAADRVRAVHGRGAAGQDFDALDHRGRNLVEVGRRVGDAAVGHAATVDEHQGAGRAEAAQVDRRGTGGAVRHVRVLRGEGLRQLVDEVFDARHALRLRCRRW